MHAENFGFDDVMVVSSGMGAIPNSFLDFVNAAELHPKFSVPHQLHRKSDPGAGAFTYQHSRHTIANRKITSGEEIFLSYGKGWFETRTDLGPIPVVGDHHRADQLYRNFFENFIRPNTNQANPDAVFRLKAFEKAWDTFVVNSAWKSTSRTLAALPPKDQYKKGKIKIVNHKKNHN